MSSQASRRRGTSTPHFVAHVDEIPPGSRRLLVIAGRSIGVFNVGGEFHALRNLCPHQQAPLCEGRLQGTTLPSRAGTYQYGREGQILRCPWHGWEFDVTTGRSLFDPNGCRVRSYPVTVDGVQEAEERLQVDRFPVTIEGRRILVHV